MIVAFIAIFYFLIMRPQQQQVKRHREMISNLRRGDEVVSGGGLIGKVTRLTDDEATLELAEGVRVKVIRSTITQVRTRTEPANDSSDDDAGETKPAAKSAAKPAAKKPAARKPAARKTPAKPAGDKTSE
jgi:preprotein translocase subunit YajC